MKFLFIAYRLGGKVEFQYSTLSAALCTANETINGDDAWPTEIREGETVLWKSNGPMDTRDSLKSFAAANGVTWIEP